MEDNYQLTSQTLTVHEEGNLYYTTFPAFDKTGKVHHAFSTRRGGLSQGYYASMNLGLKSGDDPETVAMNFNRMSQATGIYIGDMVFSDQVHGDRILYVDQQYRGSGLLRQPMVEGVDGLITDMPGVALLTFYADCVPLILIDPVRRAVGCAHSGWRGTVADMGGSVLRAMHEAFGTDPADVLAGIGPCICQDCYEVSGDVIGQVDAAFPEEIRSSLYYRKENGKYQLDLREACRQNFLRAGVPAENIAVSDLCTACNKDLLFSHRATAGKRGNIAAVVFIREEEQ